MTKSIHLKIRTPRRYRDYGRMMGVAFKDRANMIFEYYPLEGSMEAMKMSKMDFGGPLCSVYDRSLKEECW